MFSDLDGRKKKKKKVERKKKVIKKKLSHPAHRLPLLLLRRELVVLVLVYDRHVRRHHRRQALGRELDDLLLGPVVEVVEEDAAEPARLLAVLAPKVLVGPLLEPGVVGRVVLVADALVGAVEVPHVLLVDVGGGDVGASAFFFFFFFVLKKRKRKIESG